MLLVLMFLIYVVGPKRRNPHPETYKLSEKWTGEPILWAADEPADHGHGGHGHPVTVGGGASGKW